jgi:hypothetical protein
MVIAGVALRGGGLMLLTAVLATVTWKKKMWWDIGVDGMGWI